MYYLENACAMQVRTLGMGLPVHPVDDHVVQDTIAGSANDAYMAEQLVWPAMLRKVEGADPGWRARV